MHVAKNNTSSHAQTIFWANAISDVNQQIASFDLWLPSAKKAEHYGMSATGSRATRSEDELGEKWDRCVADSLIKTGESNNDAHLFLIDAHLPSQNLHAHIIALPHYPRAM